MMQSTWALGSKQVRPFSILAAVAGCWLVVQAAAFGMSSGVDSATNASWMQQMLGTVGRGEVEWVRVDKSVLSEPVPLPFIKPAEDPAFLAALWVLAAIVAVVGIASIVNGHRKLQANIRELGMEIDAMTARHQAKKAERLGSLVVSNTPNLVRNKMPMSDAIDKSQAGILKLRSNGERPESGQHGRRNVSREDDVN